MWPYELAATGNAVWHATACYRPILQAAVEILRLEPPPIAVLECLILLQSRLCLRAVDCKVHALQRLDVLLRISTSNWQPLSQNITAASAIWTQTDPHRQTLPYGTLCSNAFVSVMLLLKLA